jgi:hypothetical protein
MAEKAVAVLHGTGPTIEIEGRDIKWPETRRRMCWRRLKNG